MTKELLYAIRWRYIGHYLGQFCLIIGCLNLVPLVVAVILNDPGIVISYAVISSFLILLGLGLIRIKVKDRIQMNEAMVLACSVFIFIPLVKSIPLYHHGLSFVDALFETISAVTTTGLSTQPNTDDIPKTFLFTRSWMQWYGGLGVVILSLALVVRPGMAALKLGALESTDDLIGGTRAHARRVIKVYLGITSVALACWMVLGGAFFDGILYIFSAVSTGGFAPTNGSLADLPDPRFSWAVTLTTLAGAIPLALYHVTLKKGWKEFWGNKEFRTLLLVCICFSFFMAILFWFQGMTVNKSLYQASQMVVSAQTTSGFSSLNVGELDNGSKLVLILIMSVGGCVGSTAGGMKILRLLILFGMLYRSLISMTVPKHSIVHQRLNHRRIEPSEVQDALMIILFFTGVTFLSWCIFVMYGYVPLDALFEVVSATGTVGLSTGITQASMPDILKMVLCIDMLLGRLEFVAWMVFFYYRTWFGRKRGNT